MGEIPIRLLRADEIECRVSVINEKGLSLLLFKDARVDQKILDETFTPFGWKRSHQLINGNLYCTVEIWDREKEQWISKQDVGTMSYSEKEKGQASDSFKRACFNWGLGRELYTAPFIWIPAGKADIQRKEKNGEKKYYTNDRFSVQFISYNEERAIDALVVINSRGQMVYSMDTRGGVLSEKGRKAEPVETQKRMEASAVSSIQMTELERELERTGVALDTVLKRYKIQTMGQMTPEIYGKAMKSLKNSKDKKAA